MIAPPVAARLSRGFDAAAAHHRAGRLGQAEAGYRRILEADPGDARTLHNLGLILHGRGELNAARAAIAKAIAAKHGIAAFHNSLGNVVRDLGDGRAATDSFRRAIALDPSYAEGHYNLGNMLYEDGDLDAAEASLRKALKIKPSLAEAHNSLGNLQLDRGKPDRAAASYRLALRHAPDNGEWHNNLGEALRQQGALDEAIASLHKALALMPNLAEAHNNLGNAYKDKGRFDRAEDHYNQAIAADPTYAEPHYNRSNLKRFEAGDPAFQVLEALKGHDSLSPEESVHLHFALGKMRGDIGDHDTAFSEYARGNEARKIIAARVGQGFDRQRHADRIDRIIECFSAEFMAQREGWGVASETPLLIVGMPRSGTSLVEQILSSHGAVYGGGELPDLGAIAMGLDGPYPEAVRRLDAPGLGGLADAYLRRLEGLDPDARRVTDKMPDNFLLLGLVALMLPGARIIDCRRDPMATCLSCYFNNFTHGNSFSNDLGDLAAYYRDYRRLMDHWRAVLPRPILDLPYEDLVADQEGATRRMLDYCGLEWDGRCLEHHKNDRPVRTASNVQARQRIYSTSLRRWKPYEKFLGPLIDGLEA